MKAVTNARISAVAVHYLKTSALTTAVGAIRSFTLKKRLLKKATMMSEFNKPTDPPVFKSQQEFYDWLRNNVIDEITVEIQKMQGFGKDTLDSLCVYVQGMKI
jgi:hypothetical protein